MTDIFALDPGGQAELERTARANPVGLEALNQATPFEGTLLGIGDGLMRGGARVAQTAGLAVAAPFSVYERLAGEEGRFTDSIFRVTDEYATRAVDYWTPAAAEVGKAGQILGGLAEIAAPLMLGAGNPALLVATQTTSPAVDLVREGVSAPVAAAVGALQGASTAVGFRLPILGSTLASRLATGVAGNLALGVSTVAAQRAVLEASGTPATQQVAERYDPLSAESAALDVLTGLVFGGLTHVHVTAAQREAVLTALNAKHFQSDTAPGQPGDMASFVAHQRAMEQATEQLVRGEPVTPSAAITEASFEPRATPDPEATLASLREVLPEGERAVTEVKPRSEQPGAPESTVDETSPTSAATDQSDQAIEARFAEQLKRDPAAAEAQYAANPESKGGKVLNTDTARELSPDYLADRTRSAAVHEPASGFIKKLYAKKLAEAPKPGEEPIVLFTAGGTGAGKSTGIKKTLGSIASRAQIVFDTNMNGYESSVKKIDQALAAGKQVVIAYTMRDPIAALKEGALPRAMRQEREFGSGRTVPIEMHLDTHVGSAAAIPRLAEHYRGNPDVDIHVIDNNHGPDGPRLASLADIKSQDYNSLRDQAYQTLEAEHAAGRISESVYRGFAGKTKTAHEPRGVQGILESARPGAGGQPEAQRGSGDGRGPEAPDSGSPGSQQVTDPDVRAAHEAVATRDFEIPTGETGPDGQPVTVSARQLLTDAAAAVERAKADAPAFQAAVNCLLRGGA